MKIIHAKSILIVGVIWLLGYFPTTLGAQTMPKNTIGTGVGFSFMFQFDERLPSGKLYLAPEFEYYFLNNLGLGMSCIINQEFTTVNNVNRINTQMDLYPYLKWYLFKGLNVQGGTLIDLLDGYDPNIRYGLGYSIFVGRKTAVTPTIYVTQVLDKNAISTFSTDFIIGLNFYFNR